MPLSRGSLAYGSTDAATAAENELISRARRALSVYEESEIMIKSGLYQPGANLELDQAVAQFPYLDAFAAERAHKSISEDFQILKACLELESLGENGSDQ